jgi:hypothetical protein
MMAAELSDTLDPIIGKLDTLTELTPLVDASQDKGRLAIGLMVIIKDYVQQLGLISASLGMTSCEEEHHDRSPTPAR